MNDTFSVLVVCRSCLLALRSFIC